MVDLIQVIIQCCGCKGEFFRFPSEVCENQIVANKVSYQF